MKGHFRGRFRERREGGGQRLQPHSPGLPAHLMDECVEDLAEAVVAMLLSQATTEANERDDAGGSL
jgi:hypothetical protein